MQLNCLADRTYILPAPHLNLQKNSTRICPLHISEFIVSKKKMHSVILNSLTENRTPTFTSQLLSVIWNAYMTAWLHNHTLLHKTILPWQWLLWTYFLVYFTVKQYFIWKNTFCFLLFIFKQRVSCSKCINQCM